MFNFLRGQNKPPKAVASGESGPVREPLTPEERAAAVARYDERLAVRKEVSDAFSKKEGSE